MNDPQSGYIALTSLIIISLLLLTITAVLSAANYYTQNNILENEFKEQSDRLAESCINYAISKIALNWNSAMSNSAYAGNEQNIAVLPGLTCSVGTVTSLGGGLEQIIAQGSYPQVPDAGEKSFTNLAVIINSSFAVTSWQETSN